MKRNSSGMAAALAALALGACGSKDGTAPVAAESAKVDTAKAEAAELERPKPGLYKQSLEFVKFEMPGITQEQAAQMKGMMKTAQPSDFCLTKEASEKGFREMFDKVREGSECDFSKFDVSGGKLDAVMSCKAGGATSTSRFSGMITSTGADVTVDIDQKNSKSPMENAVITMHMKTERIGDCPG